MMMSTPFAFDVVENSMRVTVDGDGVRVAFLKGLPCTYNKGNP